MNYALLAGVFTISISLTFLLEKLGRRFSIYSKSSYRRVNAVRVPLLGGLAVTVAMMSGLFFVSPALMMKLLVCFSPLLLVGFLDDVYEIGGKWKLLAQFSAAISWLLLTQDNQGTLLVTSLGPLYIALPVGLCFLIGMTNAFNLIDGIDGQASSFAIINWIALSVVIDPQISWVAVAAIAGFGVRNLPPSKIYLGEIGSSFLGFSLAAVALAMPVAGTHVSQPLGLLALFSIPLLDTCFAIFRRVKAGTSLMKGDRKHIHHLLLKLHLNVWQALFATSTMVLIVSLSFVIWWQVDSPIVRLELFLMTSLYLGLTFSAILFWERHLGSRVERIGKNLIEMHLAVTKATKNPAPVAGTPSTRSGHRALVINLMPYIREAQELSAEVLPRFLEDLPQFVKQHQNGGALHFRETSSITVLLTDGSKWRAREIESVSADFYLLLGSHGLIRSDGDIPEGLLFFDEENLPDFIRNLVSKKPGSDGRLAG